MTTRKKQLKRQKRHQSLVQKAYRPKTTDKKLKKMALMDMSVLQAETASLLSPSEIPLVAVQSGKRQSTKLRQQQRIKESRRFQQIAAHPLYLQDPLQTILKTLQYSKDAR
jgi:hypothetical protein